MKKYKDITTLPSFITHDELVEKYSKTKGFIEAYNEEVTRILLANELKKLRIKKNLTQEELAEQVGMPQSVIARIEGGKRSLTLSTLTRIAYSLGTKVGLLAL